jgi:hypothetical protein
VNSSVPVYQVDASWPKPLPNDWILGQVSGIAVDQRDHVWLVHRPGSLTQREAGKVQNPAWADCCVPAPPVIELDPEGNVVRAWGGDGGGDVWPRSEHGIYIDRNDNVWLGSMDEIVVKSTMDGKRLLTLGERLPPGPPVERPEASPIGAIRQPPGSNRSNDTSRFGSPTDIYVDMDARETYVSDGYRNRRIIVLDAETGAYKRHWGAYGQRPTEDELPDYTPGEAPARAFRSPMHAVNIDKDGLVYAADRPNNRIQVFRKDGSFVKEAFFATWTLGMGAVWDLDFSPDPDQTFVYVPDGTNMKVWILTRNDLKVVGSFGHGGRQAGQFEWVHNLACDSRGNIYTSEVNTGKRVQKFTPRS